MHRRNVGWWAEMGSRRPGVDKFRAEDFEEAVLLVLAALARGEDVLVHCMQGRHRSGGFLCFILALILHEDFGGILEAYLKKDLLPRDRRCLMRVVSECQLHDRLWPARADAKIQQHLDTISEKLASRGVDEVSVHSPSDDESIRGVDEVPAEEEKSASPGVDVSEQKTASSSNAIAKAMPLPPELRALGARAKGQAKPVPGARAKLLAAKPKPKARLLSNRELRGSVREVMIARPPSLPPPGAAPPGEAIRGNKRLQEAMEKREAKMAKSSGSSSSSEGPSVVGSRYEWRPGDWQCPLCRNWNKEYRAQCHFRACPGAIWKPGDWKCTVCGNHNWASREFCALRKCGAPRRA